jgi:hypothetical protein
LFTRTLSFFQPLNNAIPRRYCDLANRCISETDNRKWLYDHSLVDLMHSAEEFETSVLDSLDLWFIVFTDGLHCGPCRTAMTNALRLDAGLNGIAKVQSPGTELN